ncbi:hypothetical protein ISF6_2407 [Piscinibacter sakaiensis]|uniref:Uncharacterized protein n=1 Tax=Piscinibacter sakaiensis TaxID=1547922 RepID=A0A0K8P1M8_PISS1|nr:hypothetical protein ISF6_2407 [Piscinibacter sakaiensis]
MHAIAMRQPVFQGGRRAGGRGGGVVAHGRGDGPSDGTPQGW